MTTELSVRGDIMSSDSIWLQSSPYMMFSTPPGRSYQRISAKMTAYAPVSAPDPPLPEYELDATQILPAYSAQARSSECLLLFEPPRRTGCPACEWIFETKRMKVNLGRKSWKLNSPTYGLNGSIDGSIQFSDLTYPLDSLHATVSSMVNGWNNLRC